MLLLLLLLLQRLACGLVPLPSSLQAGPPTEARSAAPAGHPASQLRGGLAHSILCLVEAANIDMSSTPITFQGRLSPAA
jgi:hypothetical protein